MRTIRVKVGSFFVDPPTANGATTIEIKHTDRYRLRHDRLEGKAYQRDFKAPKQRVAVETGRLMLETVLRDYDLEVGAKYRLCQWCSYQGYGVPNGGFWDTVAAYEVVEEEADE